MLSKLSNREVYRRKREESGKGLEERGVCGGETEKLVMKEKEVRERERKGARWREERVLKKGLGVELGKLGAGAASRSTRRCAIFLPLLYAGTA